MRERQGTVPVLRGIHMDDLSFQKMQALCKSAGFAQKGKAFFRLRGDGVLQVIKCRHERVFRSDLIYIGLASMYAPLQPKDFTAGGCLTPYPVSNCCLLRQVPVVFATSMESQLEMLEKAVLPWLDTIDTQKKLSKAISQLDGRWNDSAKIGPFLACGEHNHARKVIKEIIGDYAYAKVRSVRPKDATAEDMIARVRQEKESLYGIIEIIDRGEETVTAYLQANFEENMGWAKFCVRK